jgi:hypothetical protein
VKEILMSGWIQTAPPAPGVFLVNLTSRNASGKDFGNRLNLSISGVKFNDSNKNGVRDRGEPGLSGWTIQLKTQDGKVKARAITSQNGSFIISGLGLGSYVLSEVQQPKWNQSAPKGSVYTFNLTGQSIKGKDFGNFRESNIAGKASGAASGATGTLSVEGTVYQDINLNGKKESGEPGLKGWTVQLELPKSKVLASNVTDKNGTYAFKNLNPGNYVIREKVMPGWNLTSPLSGVHLLSLTAQSVKGKDFGNRGKLSIAGSVYNDINGSRIRERGEPGLGGWRVNLTSADRNSSTTSDKNGTYLFSNLAPGNYSVVEVLMPGWIQTAPPAPGVFLVNLTGRNASGKDFGNRLSLSISGVKFNDSNRNGVKDRGEFGLKGWTIQLKTQDGKVKARAITSQNGSFIISGLDPGRYILSEVQQPRWNQSAPNGSNYTLNLTDKSIKGKNFGNYLA